MNMIIGSDNKENWDDWDDGFSLGVTSSSREDYEEEVKKTKDGSTIVDYDK